MIKYEMKWISGYKMVDGKQVPVTEEEYNQHVIDNEQNCVKLRDLDKEEL